ncbi:MAG TPA: L,D-transpeptidase [Rhodobacteraceae bacterium]|nr:L,D-transpeptidase [Paracoccaceae bacterium]
MKHSSLSRRHFLATTAAAGSIAAGGRAFAHSTPSTPYVLPEEYNPVEVEMEVELTAGEIHVDPNIFKLYWTLGGNRAIQYTVGVGRAGLYHDGEFTVGAKKEWPSWTPTREMIQRNPGYAKWQNGMPGGINNPLGARALYLFQPGIGDTFLRIHGTNLPRTIGTAVSNGCARLTNEHIIEFYERVPVGARVVLYPKGVTPVMS